MYRKLITEILASLGRPDVDPAHVEAFMRCEYRTLDHLSRAKFVKETKAAIPPIDSDKKLFEELAVSYGIGWRERREAAAKADAEKGQS
jgi:hypothetical protein